MDLLTVADLFVVGLALDLVGAYLLLSGLLASHSTLVRRAGSYWNGNPHQAVALAEERVDARFGLVYLASGFALQMVGYALDLGLGPATEASVGRAVVGLALGLAAGVAAYVLWQRIRPVSLRRTLIEMARWDVSSTTARPERLDRPDRERLTGWGAAAGFTAEELGVETTSEPEQAQGG